MLSRPINVVKAVHDVGLERVLRKLGLYEKLVRSSSSRGFSTTFSYRAWITLDTRGPQSLTGAGLSPMSGTFGEYLYLLKGSGMLNVEQERSP